MGVLLADLGQRAVRQLHQPQPEIRRIHHRDPGRQRGTLYVFDEPTACLHPLDAAALADVFDRLPEAGAAIILIDHDLDLLAAADHLIDMGPGGGPDGGLILAAVRPPDAAVTRAA